MVDALTKQNLDVQIQEEFLMEAMELLEDVEATLIKLERDPGNKDIIGKIFRLAHTLKGGSSMSGFHDLAKFSHSFETLLSQLRDGTMSSSPGVVDVLLHSNDILKKWIAGLTRNRDFVLDTTATMHKIDSLLKPKTQPQPIIVPISREPQEEVIPDDKPVVLICEDDSTLAELIQDMFLSLDVESVVRLNGSEGLEVLKQRKVDLIVTDLKMPLLDGLGLIERVRRVNETVPIIVISGIADREDTIEFIRRGVFDFFEKPFDMERLLLASSRAITIKQNRDLLQDIGVKNFRCFMSVMQMLEQVRGVLKSPSDQHLVRNVEQALEDIQTHTSKILRTKVS